LSPTNRCASDAKEGEIWMRWAYVKGTLLFNVDWLADEAVFISAATTARMGWTIGVVLRDGRTIHFGSFAKQRDAQEVLDRLAQILPQEKGEPL
jgi:hypothetical protein